MQGNAREDKLVLIDDPTPELAGELDAGANSIGFTVQTVDYNGGSPTVDWRLGNKATITFGAGNITAFAFTDPSNPCNLILEIIQDSVGNRVVSAWDAKCTWPASTAPILTTGANAIDIIAFYWTGAAYRGFMGPGNFG